MVTICFENRCSKSKSKFIEISKFRENLKIENNIFEKL